MCTNGSRHIVSFSDLAWPTTSPTFPKAWQVGQYLKRYLDKYPGIDLRTSSRVVKTARVSSPSENTKKWQVDIQKAAFSHSHTTHVDLTNPTSLDLLDGSTGQSPSTSSETHYFDRLIVASGFFGKLKFPEILQESSYAAIPTQHSLQFRDVNTLFSTSEGASSDHGGNILVVGGSFSGVEVAAGIASQLSSQVYAPGEPRLKIADQYKVHHVVKRPLWVAPLFIPTKTFLESEGEECKVCDFCVHNVFE